MTASCNNSRISCTVIAVVTSLIIGIITAFLRITAVITLTPAFLWVLLGISAVYLAVVLVAAALFCKRGCENLCNTVTVLLTGIVATVFLSVLLLAVEFVATSIIGAILTGALLFAFFLTVTSTACLVNCFYNCRE